MSRGEPLTLVLKVLRQLQAGHAAGRGATLEELAADCEVSTRTIRRKIGALRDAGIEIVEAIDEDRRKRYALDHARLPSSHVTFEPFEAAALVVADGMMASMEGLPLAREARAAIEKATTGVPVAFRRELEGLVGALRGTLTSSHDYAAHGRRFTNLVDAIEERWPVEIEYRSLSSPGGTKTHVIHPYLVHCQAGTVYVVARRAGEDRILTFALDRIDAVRVRDDDSFERPAGFDPERFVAESFNGYHGGEVALVRVRFAAEVARVIRERVWHGSQRIEDARDGAIVVTFETAGPLGVLHWAKSFLPHATILEPRWLAVRQREEVMAWLAALDSHEA
jgi:predicted DNA-binding transcriptional regulator YafY